MSPRKIQVDTRRRTPNGRISSTDSGHCFWFRTLAHALTSKQLCHVPGVSDQKRRIVSQPWTSQILYPFHGRPTSISPQASCSDCRGCSAQVDDVLQNFVEPQGPLKGKPVHLNVIPPEAVDVRQPRLEMDLPVCPCDQKRRRTAF